MATDGRTASDSALVAAQMLAGRLAFTVISVLAESASKDRTTGWGYVPETPRAHYELVPAQVHRVLGDSADVWIEVRRGYPPAVLASYAESHQATLLVAGLGRAQVLQRLLGDESALPVGLDGTDAVLPSWNGPSDAPAARGWRGHRADSADCSEDTHEFVAPGQKQREVIGGRCRPEAQQG